MIKILKLTTGEEVIADVEHKDGNYELTNSIRLVLTQEGAGMMPFAPFSKDDKITVPEQHVIYKADVEDEVLNAYNSKFGSGIVVPPSDLKIVR